MKKKIAIALALCLVMVGIMAAPVFAAAQKVDLVSVSDDPGRGFVIANACQGPLTLDLYSGNYYHGASDMQLSLKGAKPNADYDVFMMISLLPGVWVPITTITTSEQGNANLHMVKRGIPPITYDVEYALYRDGEMRFITDAVTLTIK